MDLCRSCHEAVRLLFPRAKDDKPVQLTISGRVQKLDSITHNNCWICYQLEERLKSYDEDKLNSWLQAPLAVTYQYLGLANATFPFRFKQVMSYLLMVKPDRGAHDSNEEGACVELACIDRSTYQVMLDASQRNTSPQIDFVRIRDWVSMCSAHVCCNQQPVPFLPARLLRISDDGKSAKLILVEDEFGDSSTTRYQSQRYVTLSHRWGAMEYKKLLASTLHELQQEVVVSALPQVFQDAFVVAAQIRISLVWIDSLCIMQDPNGVDLKIQCQLMHKIYASAFLNISSTGCEDNTSSMLQKRMRVTTPKPQKFKARYNLFPRTRYVVEGHVWIDEIAHAPLSNRGWVFQERHLARRVLHLGSNVMAWECRELDALETCPQGLPEKIILNSLAKRDLFQQLGKARSGMEKSVTQAHDTWRALVEEYSQCKLTYAADKLLALRGLAAYFGEVFEDEYVAGLWKKSLAIDLIWHRDSCSEDKDALKRAPSWSWASVDGQIQFPHDLSYDKTRIRTSDIHFSSLIDTFAIDAVAEDRKAVSLKGYAYKLRCEWQNEKIVSFTIGGQLDFPAFGGTPCNAVRIDRSVRELQACNDLVFLILATSNVSIHGLVLSQLPGHSDAYQRLGSVEIAMMFPCPEVNGKQVIDKLRGEWREHYVPSSLFPRRAQIGPFLYSPVAQKLLWSMDDSPMSEITIH